MYRHALWIALVATSVIAAETLDLEKFLNSKLPVQYDLDCDPLWKEISPNHTMCTMEDLGTGVPLSQQEKDTIVRLHNELRAKVQPLAADMMKLAWDENLALVAAKWARQCRFRHDQNRNVPSLPDVNIGQNMGVGYSNFSSAINNFYDEVQYFQYGVGPTVASKTIGHYTQVVNSRAQSIGCGKANCPGLPFFVCNYAPGQNEVLQPYKNSTASCSACPKSCDASGKLCDCGGKVCTHDGTLNVNTCTCTCPRSMYQGDTCNTLNCPQQDNVFCGHGKPWLPVHCHDHKWMKTECPYLCGVCPHACGSKQCYNGSTMDWQTCQCNCAAGFEGDPCGTAKCRDKVCKNGGAMDWNTCNCSCTEYYEGEECQFEACGGIRCQNGGDLDKSTCKCRCWPAWRGISCEKLTCPEKDDRKCGPGRYWPPEHCIDYNVAGSCPNMCNICPHACGNKTCLNNGLVDYKTCTCECVDLYAGHICERVACPNADKYFCGMESWATSCTTSFVRDHCPSYCGVCKRACGSTQKRCQNGGTLENDSCTCHCPSSYIGDICQFNTDGLANVALRKMTKLSSVYSSATGDKAVDGNLDTNFHKGSCTIVGYLPGRRWWYVDLGTLYDIYAVLVTSRGDCCAYNLANFNIEVFVNNPESASSEALLCSRRVGAMPQGVTEAFVCSTPQRGRFVKISQPQDQMQFCEVQVLAR